MSFWDVVNTVGNVVENTVEASADTIEDVVEVVTEAVEEFADSVSEVAQDIDPTNGFLTAPIVLFFGIISGGARALGDLNHDVSAIASAVGGVFGAVLRGDLGGALDRLGDLGIHLIDLVGIGLRIVTAGYFIGAIKKQADKASLRRYVQNLIETEFVDSPEARALIFEGLGLSAGRLFRWEVPAEHRIMRMDSQTVDAGNLPLWQMHQNGDLNLYEMAGLASYRSDGPFVRPDTAVVEVTADGNDAFWPIARKRIDFYLQSRGRDVRLRVYSMTRRTASEKMNVARRKLNRLAIYLDWNDPLIFSNFRSMTTVDIDVEENQVDYSEDATGEPFSFRDIHAYKFNFAKSDSFLTTNALRSGARNEQCTVLALSAFEFYEFGFFGMTLPFGDSDNRPSVIYHLDRWPQFVFRYILAHEIGHYFGLQHYDGINNLMYTAKESNWFPSNVLHFWLNKEPEFSLEQGKRAWDFIVSQRKSCLTE